MGDVRRLHVVPVSGDQSSANSEQQEECRLWQLRDTAARVRVQRESAGTRLREHYGIVARDFDRQAEDVDCECGHCGDDEG